MQVSKYPKHTLAIHVLIIGVSTGFAQTLRLFFVGVISKIVFRTGVVEEALFKMMAKTKCQIAASVDDTSAEDLGAMRRSKIWKATANAYTWTFSVDSSNAPKPPPDAPPSPTRKERKTENITISTKGSFKMGEDFLITVPITGERVNVRICRANYFNGKFRFEKILSAYNLMMTFIYYSLDLSAVLKEEPEF